MHYLWCTADSRLEIQKSRRCFQLLFLYIYTCDNKTVPLSPLTIRFLCATVSLSDIPPAIFILCEVACTWVPVSLGAGLDVWFSISSILSISQPWLFDLHLVHYLQKLMELLRNSTIRPVHLFAGRGRGSHWLPFLLPFHVTTEPSLCLDK